MLIKKLFALFAVLSVASCSDPVAGTIDTTTSCASPMATCEQQCVDLQRNALNCGACGRRCANAESCMMGACRVSCPSGQDACSGVCVNQQSNALNCGACGNRCPMGQSCASGGCVAGCPPPLATCGGECVDTQSDARYCGGCGNACAGGQSCSGGRCSLSCSAGQMACSGRCVDLQTDGTNCGICGVACMGGQVCASGGCVTSGVPDAGRDLPTVDPPRDVPVADTGVTGCGAMDLGSAVRSAVASGTTVGRTSLHTPPATCTDMPMAVAPDAIYVWTAPYGGTFTFDTVGSALDTVLTVRSGSCTGTALACNDDIANGMIASRATVTLGAGQTIVLAIDGYGTRSGAFVLNVSAGGAIDAGGPLDAGTDAGGTVGCEAMNLGSAIRSSLVSGTTVGRSSQHTPTCGMPAAVSPDAIYTWTAPFTGAFTFDTVGSVLDTVLTLRNGSCTGAALGCNDDAGGTAGVTSRVAVTLAAGQTVLIAIDGYGTASGAYVLNVIAGSGVDAGSPDAGTADAGGSDTRLFRGQFMYEHYAPNAGRTNWVSSGYVGGQNFLVQSVRGTTVIGQTTTSSSVVDSENGTFVVPVPTRPTASDRIVVYAASLNADGTWRYAVASPNLATGRYVAASGTPPSPLLWGWQFAVSSLPADGVLRINECVGGEVPDNATGCRTGWQGAGAARFFDYARYVYEVSVETYGTSGAGALLVWLQPGVTWDCGECQTRWPVSAFGHSFSNQVFVAGSVGDRQWWSDSVTAHELGHWVMDRFSQSPNEGTPHSYGMLSSPGMAWSEGFASWYSSWARRSSVFIDKQGSFMFWLDYSTRSSPMPGIWSPPSAGAGLLQPMVENVLTSILWSLAPVSTGAEAAPLHAALSSARMRSAPFARGYRNPEGTNVPVFADFLDALNCAGFSRTRIDAARLAFPYNTSSPLCR